MKNGIFKFFFKRIISSLIILFLLVSFLFVLIRISPGSPIQKFISPVFSSQLIQEVEKSFNLDEPIVNQYLRFGVNLIKGDFGISFDYRISVLSVIMQFLPFTITLAIISFLVQISFGFFAAIISIKYRHRPVDNLMSKLSIIFYSLPVFIVGVILVYVFSVQLNIFPSSGIHSFGLKDANIFVKIIDFAKHLVLPVITLSFYGIALYYKYLRENLENIYHENFILNLRSTGLNEKKILLKHVIPNAVNPLITTAGIDFGFLLGGALITEVIFALPGMGRLTMNAILSRDYPLVIGCGFTAGVMLLITNFLADLIKYKIDKRLIKGMSN